MKNIKFKTDLTPQLKKIVKIPILNFSLKYFLFIFFN